LNTRMHSNRIEFFLVFYRMHLVFYSGSKKSLEKGFSGIESHQGGDCGDVYTSPM
jgi:hypothetical protein